MSKSIIFDLNFQIDEEPQAAEWEDEDNELVEEDEEEIDADETEEHDELQTFCRVYNMYKDKKPVCNLLRVNPRSALK